MDNEYDYIIVGQGLAGTCLAHSLRSRQKSVLVFNDPNQPSASKVAGGLFNPITGRNMVLTWMAHELFPFLHKFYKGIEHLLQEKILHNIPIYRPFNSIEELNEWQGKSSDERFRMFIHKIHDKPIDVDQINNLIGGVEMTQTGYLQTKALLKGYEQLLAKDSALISGSFNLDLMNLQGKKVVYKEYSAKKIIFCDGPAVIKNKWFAKVKMVPLKGEVLKIKTTSRLSRVLSKGIFVLPLGDDPYCCLVGSTYERNNVTWQPTDRARQEIEQKLQQIVNFDYEVVDHIAGVRPTMVDRRPVLGCHPEENRVVIFNGLGTKGVSLAPYFSDHLAQHLVDNHQLCSEVDVRRFFK